MAKKRPRGRPELPEDEAQVAYIGFRLKAADKEKAEEAAALGGLKLSDWCRDRLCAVARREIKRAESKR